MARTKLCKKTGKNLVWDDAKGKWRPETKKEAAVDKFDYSRPAHYAMSDIQEFVSPVDGSLISSRSSLARHNATHGVRQCGDFKPGEIVARENKRIDATRQAAKEGTIKWL
jgi:hypothetical protein